MPPAPESSGCSQPKKLAPKWSHPIPCSHRGFASGPQTSPVLARSLAHWTSRSLNNCAPVSGYSGLSTLVPRKPIATSDPHQPQNCLIEYEGQVHEDPGRLVPDHGGCGSGAAALERLIRSIFQRTDDCLGGEPWRTALQRDRCPLRRLGTGALQPLRRLPSICPREVMVCRPSELRSFCDLGRFLTAVEQGFGLICLRWTARLISAWRVRCCWKRTRLRPQHRSNGQGI
jgi:hypothetical protein